MQIANAYSPTEPLHVADTFDADGHLRLHVETPGRGTSYGYLDDLGARALRDHLTAVLGEDAKSDRPTRAEALRLAEEAVARMVMAGGIEADLADWTTNVEAVAAFLLGSPT